jgi:hypothetical protein
MTKASTKKAADTMKEYRKNTAGNVSPPFIRSKDKGYLFWYAFDKLGLEYDIH